jgi:hypothetical protein
MKRIARISVLTFSMIGLCLVLAIATSRNVRAAVSALVTVSNTTANPVPTQSMEDKNAFQVDINLGLSSQVITIPAGQRLVVDFVSISGIADSLSGAIQPSIILASTLNGGGSANYYLQPGPTPVNIPGANQLYFAQPVKVYADTLTVEPAYAGFAPFTYTFNVSISGHLVPIP